MALVEVKVPQLSESVAEATLLAWKKKPGDAVAIDEILIEIETDKVVLEVPAPAAGVLGEIVVADGGTVVSDQLIARIDTEGKGAAAAPAAAAAAPAAAPAARVAAPAAAAAAGGSKAGVAMPAAAKLMADNNLAPGSVAGTGRDGRVTKGDVLGAVAAGASAPATGPAVQAPMPAAVTKPLPAVAAPAGMNLGDRPEQRVPMSRLAALKKYPIVNASVDGNDIVYHGYFDIGIAVGSPRGLVVPVLRNVDQMSFADIEKKIAEFGAKARDGKLGIEELTGGTFSISNGGTFGSMLSTPIINPPQSAILGVHATKDRAVVENGQVVVRPMNYLAMSYDHRIIDGREAVLALVAMKEALEDPARLLFDI
ncbi:MAG: dihydrolipoamide succinyltransferase [Betaproteobacteria bacterium]|nr:dihydrolipoamide succinyltransferase [Betaproteobacteria bacterium]